MSDTTFVNGTIVQPTWLNDVNTLTYHAASGIAGTVPRTGTSIFAGLPIPIQSFGADPTGVVDSYLAFVSAVATGRAIDLGAGTYKVGTSIDCTANQKLIVRGESFRHAIINFTGSGALFNLGNVSDVIDQTFIFENFKAVGTNLNTGLSAAFRHMYVIRNVAFYNFLIGNTLANCFIGALDNVDFYTCDTSLNLGANTNRFKATSCRFVNYASVGINIAGGGFGCIAIEFDNCDIEFGQTGSSCVRNFTDDHITFRDCYIGDGCTGNCFEITTGQLVVSGGLVSYGSAAGFTNRIVEFIGSNPTTDERSLEIRNAKISGGSFSIPSNQNMVKGTGQLYIVDCGFASVPGWSGSSAVITGDPIGRRPGLNALLSPHGRTFVGAKTGTATFTASPNLTTGSLFLQCTASGGAGDVVYAHAVPQVGKLQTFGALGAIIVYKSNSAWGAQMASLDGTFNTAPVSMLGSTVLSNTSSVLSTMIIYNQTPLTAPYSTVEIFRANCAVNDFIEIFEVYLFDERQSGTLGTLYAGKNIYKPI